MPEALKWLNYENLLVITHLFNYLWDTETFPKIGQASRVTLLHKGNSTDNILNFRTIALTCNLVKVFCSV